MNILKIIRKPKTAIFLSTLILYTSCSNQADLINPVNTKMAFDYSIYNTYKGVDINKYRVSKKVKQNSLQSKESLSSLETFSYIIDDINSDFTTELDVNKLDKLLLENNLIVETPEYLQPVDIIKEDLPSNDIIIGDKFENDLNLYGFETALNNFESNVLSMNLTQVEFEKYNQLANVLSLLNNSNPEYFSNSNYLSKSSTMAKLSPCGKAIFWNSLATVGLVACGTGWLCALAIAAKIGAMDSMIETCTGKSFL